MILIAITLITIGAADLLRRKERFAEQRLPYPAIILAVVLPLLLASLVGVTHAQDWLVLSVGIATTIGWIVTSHNPFGDSQRHGLPLGILVSGVAIMAFYGVSEAPNGVLTQWLNSNGLPGVNALGAERVLLFIGAGLVQLSTGNVIVRLVLAHIGALKPPGEPQANDRLKGGRLLGPMERVFILGLGLAGQITAAGLVIAAKGLIRFPELQAQAKADIEGLPDLSRPRPRRGPGIDELTELFPHRIVRELARCACDPRPRRARLRLTTPAGSPPR